MVSIGYASSSAMEATLRTRNQLKMASLPRGDGRER